MLLNNEFNFQYSFVFIFANMTVVAPFLTFPNIRWWTKIVEADLLILDGGEHFEKMTCRNRYSISGANNPILLTVPLVNGRNQHVQMKDVRIYNEDKWQIRHWRTLVSVYNRAPFFDHYARSLEPIFEMHFDTLTDFNLTTLQWVKQQLRLKFDVQQTGVFVKDYPQEITDLRGGVPEGEQQAKYRQIFEDRIGFQKDLSILDLLFSEGPAAVNWLKG